MPDAQITNPSFANAALTVAGLSNQFDWSTGLDDTGVPINYTGRFETRRVDGTAVTAGQVLQFEPADSDHPLSVKSAGAINGATVCGVALHDAAVGDLVRYATDVAWVRIADGNPAAVSEGDFLVAAASGLAAASGAITGVEIDDTTMPFGIALSGGVADVHGSGEDAVLVKIFWGA